MPPERTLAVALHDIEPATFERAALMREWLDDLGVDRVTLLVIPARDLHPLSDRRPEVAAWLVERAGRGDAIAQHGFRHLQSRPPRWPPHPLTAIARESPEFVGLDPLQTVRVLDAGRRILKLAGLEPRGFVAPAYAYTPQLRESLRTRFQWWAGAWALHPTRTGAPQYLSAPPIGLLSVRPAATRDLAGPAARGEPIGGAHAKARPPPARSRILEPHARAPGRDPPRDAEPRVRHLRRSCVGGLIRR
jgi:Uncharacterized protein conserved in bacteria (DUF2334)